MNNPAAPSPAFGPPVIAADVKAIPEHFVVREWLGFNPDGDGDHMLLTVRKRGANTLWVAKQLAKHANADARDVGFSGLKDRHAVTEQAYTVPSRHMSPESWLGLVGEGFEVIAAVRHRRKLKRGSHKGNEFAVVLTNVNGDMVALQQRLAFIQRIGVPNYFGPQRFGIDQHNITLAQDWFEHGRVVHDRTQRGFALSAARALIFNAVLQARVIREDWNHLLVGDVANLNGSNSVFAVEAVDALLQQRCAEFDIHPTGPLWGTGDLASNAEVLKLESEVAEMFASFARGLSETGLCHERRPLRVWVRNFAWTLEGTQLILNFSLSRGSFATAVIAELIGAAANHVGEGEDA